MTFTSSGAVVNRRFAIGCEGGRVCARVEEGPLASKDAATRANDGPARGSSSTPMTSSSSSPRDMFAVFDACGADIVAGNPSLLSPSSWAAEKLKYDAGCSVAGETTCTSLSDDALFFPALFLGRFSQIKCSKETDVRRRIAALFQPFHFPVFLGVGNLDRLSGHLLVQIEDLTRWPRRAPRLVSRPSYGLCLYLPHHWH